MSEMTREYLSSFLTALFSEHEALSAFESSTFWNPTLKQNTIPSRIDAEFLADKTKEESRKSNPVAKPTFFGRHLTKLSSLACKKLTAAL
mmetsp:Transcript_19140/g.45082  ORF Transcript_19140/g.45082 Transcript_19140/m.45082 type:complete len:90 (+) Transcript_19140:2126-2395(+)